MYLVPKAKDMYVSSIRLSLGLILFNTQYHNKSKLQMI
jgi:hypothetical protein